MVPSLEAHRHLKATLRLCSWESGWRSLLLREYLDQPHEDEFTTAATPDHLFVLVTAGACRMESRRDGKWLHANLRPGTVSMRPAGRAATLRWVSDQPHTTLQLHLPSPVLSRQIEELARRDLRVGELSHPLATEDRLIQDTLTALREGLRLGLPDLYGETAAEFLGSHLLHHHCDLRPLTRLGAEDRRLQRVEAYMRDHLGQPLSLGAMADVAGLSRFHFLRLFKRAYGETPLKRLTRLRMQEAKLRLQRTRQSVTEIASQCGYDNPANFASAFRRLEGVSPRACRRQPARRNGPA